MNILNVKLSVIIPCYNEEKNIPLLLESLDTLVKDYSNIEILLVNNGSTDNTEKIMLEEINKREKQIFRFVKVETNQGYGYGILKGLDAATGEILSWTHADLQTNPQDLITGFKKLNENRNKISIIKGKRLGRPLFDQFFTRMMELYANVVLKTSLNDINAQPKMFSHEFYNDFIQNKAPHDFSLDLFLLWSAEKNNYSILDFPVTFTKRLYGEAKGGGSLRTKWKLTKRTLGFITSLKERYQ